MPPDEVRLRHMLDAARDAISFARGRNRSDLDSDRQFVLALVQCVQMVGEAAARVSEDTRSTLPNLPWPGIVGMRNRLVHGYYDIRTGPGVDTPTLVCGSCTPRSAYLPRDPFWGSRGSRPRTKRHRARQLR